MQQERGNEEWFSQNEWISGVVQAQGVSSAITLIKETYNGKSDKDSIKLKLRRDPTFSTFNLYYLGCLCLTMASQKSFCCSCVTST